MRLILNGPKSWRKSGKRRKTRAKNGQIRSCESEKPEDMPLVYADTSALFAFFHPKDEFTDIVTEAVRRYSPDFVYWSFLRYELRHNLRQARTDRYGELAWKALRASERTQARLRWHPELKCDSILE